MENEQPKSRPAAPEDTSRLAKALGMYVLKERLDPQEIISRLSSLSVLGYPEGANIVSEGTSGSELYIVSRGSATVFRGGQQVARLSAGDIFGEVAFFSGEAQVRSATVRAGEGCEVFRCEANGFKDLLSKYPRLLESIRGIDQARFKKLSGS